MPWLKKHAASARVVAVIMLGGLGLSACASTSYVDERIAAVNSRIDQVDARVQTVAQRADAANTAALSAGQRADAANAAAQAAATDARTANQRLDQVGGRLDTLEKPKPTTGKKPRG